MNKLTQSNNDSVATDWLDSATARPDQVSDGGVFWELIVAACALEVLTPCGIVSDACCAIKNAM